MSVRSALYKHALPVVRTRPRIPCCHQPSYGPYQRRNLVRKAPSTRRAHVRQLPVPLTPPNIARQKAFDDANEVKFAGMSADLKQRVEDYVHSNPTGIEIASFFRRAAHAERNQDLVHFLVAFLSDRQAGEDAFTVFSALYAGWFPWASCRPER